MKFGIGAIFKDEFDYILEWLAWHRVAGFSEFFIADNGSKDGTRQLLEALAEAGFIKLFCLPAQTKVQLVAYQKILEKYGHLADAIAFVDADEFICSDDDTQPVAHLERLFADKSVGAVGINWRIFGSSGKEKQETGLVIERFCQCAEDKHRLNTFVKSVVRPSVAIRQRVHQAIIHDKFRYLNCQNQDIEIHCARSKVAKSPLRVNHYAIKSLEEFTNKKRKRGDAIKGADYDRGYEFFVEYDLNNLEFSKAAALAEAVRNEISKIEMLLRLKTPYYTQGKAAVKFHNKSVSGWVALETGKAKVMIFVNGQLRAEVGAFHYRPKLAEAGLSDGHCAFHHAFNPPLQAGDVVNVSLYAQQLQFKQQTFSVESK